MTEIQIPPAPVNIHVNIDFSLLLVATGVVVTTIIIIKSVEQYNWNLKLEIGYFRNKKESRNGEEVAQQHILFDYLFNERRSVWILLCRRLGNGNMYGIHESTSVRTKANSI